VEKNMRLTLRQRQALSGYAFIAIWLVGISVFLMYPLIRNLLWSFTDAALNKNIDHPNFIGVANYVEAFVIDAKFVPLLLETLRNLLVDTPIILLFSLAVAILSEQKVRGQGFFRAIFFLPVVIGSAEVVGRLFQIQGNQLTLFQGEQINTFLHIFLGANTATFLEFVNRIVFVLWRSGVQIMIFIAGLKGIDPVLYEAAQMDGATPWVRFWKVTLPMLTPVLIINVVYTIIDSFTDYFNGVMGYIRDVTFVSQLRFGYPSALGNIYFIIIFAIVISIFLVLNRRAYYGGER
jgi:ABC-type sugar transport system permease subunit